MTPKFAPVLRLGLLAMSKLAEIVQTECKDCGTRVHWKVEDVDSRRTEWEPLDAEPCKHREDHHEASHRARLNKSGRAFSHPVSARLLTKHLAA
jgi:hypothetical protein